MEKVVILARVSTDKQEYQRQINELTDYCNKVGLGSRQGVCKQGQRCFEDRGKGGDKGTDYLR